MPICLPGLNTPPQPIAQGLLGKVFSAHRAFHVLFAPVVYAQLVEVVATGSIPSVIIGHHVDQANRAVYRWN